MTDDIYDPLDEYVNTFQPRFEQVAKDTFAKLAKEAQVDVDANRQTCRLLYDAEKSLGAVKSRIGWTTFLCVILWCCAAIGIFAICKDYGTMSPAIATAVLLSVLAAVILLLSVIHPRLKRLKAERGDLKQTIAQHKDEAWEQMAPLNRLYDWDVLTRMMTETVPRLEFDPYFTEQRLDIQHLHIVVGAGAGDSLQQFGYFHCDLPFCQSKTDSVFLNDTTTTFPWATIVPCFSLWR